MRKLSVILNILMILLLLTSIIVFIANERKKTEYMLQYSSCDSIDELSILNDFMKEKINIDFTDIYLNNVSEIILNDKDIIKLNIECFYINNGIKNVVTLELTNNFYYLSVYSSDLEAIISNPLNLYLDMIVAYSNRGINNENRFVFSNESVENVKPSRNNDYIYEDGELSLVYENKIGTYILVNVFLKEESERIYYEI